MSTIHEEGRVYDLLPIPFYDRDHPYGFHDPGTGVMTLEQLKLFHKIERVDPFQNCAIYGCDEDNRELEWLRNETLLCVNEGIVCKAQQKEKPEFSLIFPYHAIGHMLRDLKCQVQQEFEERYNRMEAFLQEAVTVQCEVVAPSNNIISANGNTIWNAILKHLSKCELVIDIIVAYQVTHSEEGNVTVVMQCKRQPKWFLDSEQCCVIEKQDMHYSRGRQKRITFCTNQRYPGSLVCVNHQRVHHDEKQHHNEILRERLWYEQKAGLKVDKNFKVKISDTIVQCQISMKK